MNMSLWRWVRAVVLVGAVYAVAGLLFGPLAGRAGSDSARVAWRLAAWVLSVAAFGAHIGYEALRLRSASAAAALHASLAVALGAFALAVSANVHARGVPGPHQAIELALVLWPLLTGLPAFVVALVAAAAARRFRARHAE